MKIDGENFVMVGWVYFIDAPEVRRVKIGYTGEHPSTRSSGVQGMAPVDLELIALVRGRRCIESLLHNRFHEAHWRGEWFDRTALIDEFIREVALPPSAADEVSYPLWVKVGDWIEMEEATTDRICDWFEARGVTSKHDIVGRGNRRARAIRSKAARLASNPHIRDCPRDYYEAIRPLDLLREAFRFVEPKWRLAFLQIIRGEPAAPGFLAYAVARPERLRAIEACLSENSSRMRHFAVSMEELIDGIPYDDSAS